MELDTDYIKDNAAPPSGVDTVPDAALDVSVTAIDPNGDLVLLVGDVSLLVSSKVLSVASPVFRTMLGPRFKEGKSLAQRKPVELKGDDAEALTKLCQILHFHGNQPDATEFSSIDSLILLAKTADKYDCLDAIWPKTLFGLESLSESLDTTSTPADLFPLLEAAYRLDDAETFKRVTRQILLHDGGEVLKAIEEHSPENPVPLKVFCGLHKRRLNLIKQIEDGLQNVISNLIDKQGYEPTKTIQNREYGVINHTHHKFNMHDCVVVSAFLRELRRIDLWGSSLGTRKLHTLLDRFLDFEHNDPGQRLGFALFAKQTGCTACMLDTQSKMAALYHSVLKNSSGLCLDCFNKEQSPEQESECRVAHG